MMLFHKLWLVEKNRPYVTKVKDVYKKRHGILKSCRMKSGVWNRQPPGIRWWHVFVYLVQGLISADTINYGQFFTLLRRPDVVIFINWSVKIGDGLVAGTVFQCLKTYYSIYFIYVLYFALDNWVIWLIFHAFSNGFSCMKIYIFWLKIHWSLFPRVQLTILMHCVR